MYSHLKNKKVQGQWLQVTKTPDIKEGQEDKPFYYHTLYRNGILQSIFTTTIDLVTWLLLQTMLDSTERWPSDKS